MSGWRNLKLTLAEPNFRFFTIGNVASLIGTWVQRVTVGWLTWEMTRSETWLGLIAFADLFPVVFIAPIAGAYADRHSRLSVTRFSQALLMVQSLALFLFAVFGLLTIELLFILTFIGGMVAGFNQPARLALVPELVDLNRISTAIAVNSISFNTARFIGPAIAGLLLVTVGAAWAFFLNFLTFAAFLAALLAIKLSPREKKAIEATPFFPSVVEGYRYISGHVGLWAMVLMSTVVSLLIRPLLELLPSYADLFSLGVGGFAMFTSVIGIGALIGGVWMALDESRKLLLRVVFLSGFLLGAALLVAALAPNEAIALAALAVLGFGLVSTGIANQSVMQLVTEPRMRGRVMALHGMIFRGTPALGALITGSIAEMIGLVLPLVVGAVLTVAFTFWLWARRDIIRSSLGLG